MTPTGKRLLFYYYYFFASVTNRLHNYDKPQLTVQQAGSPTATGECLSSGRKGLTA